MLKACSVLPTLLFYMYASANVDLVAKIKSSVFVVNHAFSPIWSPGQGKDFIAEDLQNEAASDQLGTKGVTLKGWNCVWSNRRKPPQDGEDWHIKARKRTGGDNATGRHLGEGHIEAHKLVTRAWQKPELMEQTWKAPGKFLTVTKTRRS